MPFLRLALTRGAAMQGLSDLLDKSVADRSHLGKPTSLRRGQLKRLVVRSSHAYGLFRP